MPELGTSIFICAIKGPSANFEQLQWYSHAGISLFSRLSFNAKTQQREGTHIAVSSNTKGELSQALHWVLEQGMLSKLGCNNTVLCH